jgi:hypothetical protein
MDVLETGPNQGVISQWRYSVPGYLKPHAGLACTCPGATVLPHSCPHVVLRKELFVTLVPRWPISCRASNTCRRRFPVKYGRGLELNVLQYRMASNSESCNLSNGGPFSFEIRWSFPDSKTVLRAKSRLIKLCRTRVHGTLCAAWKCVGCVW